MSQSEIARCLKLISKLWDMPLPPDYTRVCVEFLTHINDNSSDGSTNYLDYCKVCQELLNDPTFVTLVRKGIVSRAECDAEAEYVERNQIGYDKHNRKLTRMLT